MWAKRAALLSHQSLGVTFISQSPAIFHFIPNHGTSADAASWPEYISVTSNIVFESIMMCCNRVNQNKNQKHKPTRIRKRGARLMKYATLYGYCVVPACSSVAVGRHDDMSI